MLFEVIVIGSFWFWLFMALSLGGLILSLANESLGWSTTVFVGTLLIVGLFTDATLFTLIYSNPLWFGVILLGYLGIGVFWGISKWYMYLKDKKFELQEMQREFRNTHKIASNEEIPLHLIADYRREAARVLDGRSYHGVADRDITPPSPGDHKWDIIRWMTFWPLSFMWSILDDFILGFYERVYRRIRVFLEGLSIRVFRQDLDEINALRKKGLDE